ncbi:hypothetical protein DYB31_006740 [Aphanomyces astaci]|uniref:Uncharacterized protein n=1 Tax=Aphanomyces astaci TaxID=112090 RepID=A0A397FH00_APHAT|nr:hypothetical protein DYB31_006740 [Aphanomyces astaci]
MFKRGVRHARAESCPEHTDRELNSNADFMKLLRTREVRLEEIAAKPQGYAKPHPTPRHPNRQRHSYARNKTDVTLDDIYISARSAHKLSASGDHTPSRLSGVKPIRAVNTRYLTKGDISTFGEHTSQLLLEGRLPPPDYGTPPHAGTMWSPQETTDWLQGAVQNLYDILYTSAKLKWGETSQTRKALNREVAIQRTNRCTAQLRLLLRLYEAVPPTGKEYHRLAHMVEWLKWIRNPNLLPPTCWHRSGAIAPCKLNATTVYVRACPQVMGVSQELRIAAPACIRERERTIINLILRTGLVSPILGCKQMIYLAKSATAHGVVNLDPGLPPWRPITVQSALSSRIFTVIRDYISPCIPNEELQHGFQRDRTVQDAAMLTSVLIERAERRKEDLFLISKDCLKCFDRIPGWVMEYIYRKLGVPSLPRQFMAHFLGASQIDIRTAFGWLDGANTHREPEHAPSPASSSSTTHLTFLRIANDRGSPAHDILMESLEFYQIESGLTYHPLAFRIPPPASDTTFLGTLLRDLATFNPALTITTQWHQPPASRPHRPNDRPIWAHLTPALSTTLISINRSHANKVRWVGDITNEKGTMLLSFPSLCTKYGWNRAILQRFTPIWDAIPTVTTHNPPPILRQQTIQWGLSNEPRYSNIHRVELRSLMALLTPAGTFADDWIRTHQDSTSTKDPVLRAKQALLAEADSLATLAHQLLPHTNYAHLILPDSWELRDHNDLPVTDANAPWLGAIYSRHDWHAAQVSKPDARRTIQLLRLNTGELCKWDLPALSSYWRAICYTLHTNVRKHRIQPRWDTQCRKCPDFLDMQEHRFGLTHPHCPAAISLVQDLLLATQAVIPKAWLPDQDIYLPDHCTASAISGWVAPMALHSKARLAPLLSVPSPAPYMPPMMDRCDTPPLLHHLVAATIH